MVSQKESDRKGDEVEGLMGRQTNLWRVRCACSAVISCESALTSPLSPQPCMFKASRTWLTCWNSQAQHYSRNVGLWLLV